MNITYDYYRIFYYVAKYKSFTKAAKILMNSQPNITRSMNNLEHQLGCHLLIRSNRGISLTPEGKKLYHHVAIAFEELYNAELELSSEKNLQNGTITIGASETALHSFLLTKLNEYHKTYPNIRIRILNHTMPQAMEALKKEWIDFAVVTSHTNVKTPYKAVPLFQFREIPICSHHYRELAIGSHFLSELLDYPIICLGRETGTFQFYTELFSRHGLHLRPDIEAATTDLIIPMIKNDLGIGFVPEHLAKEALENKEVFPISLVEEIPLRNICFIKNTEWPLSIAASQFEKMLKEEN